MDLQVSERDLILSRDYTSSENEKVDFRNVVCVKPWGHEFLAYESQKMGIWCLTVRKGHATSLHCHFHKDTIMIVLSGCAKLETLEGITDLHVMSRVHIPKRKFHAVSSFSDETVILEMEVFDQFAKFSDKNDLLRINDQYNRKRNGYETSVTLDKNIEQYDYFWLGNTGRLKRFGAELTVSVGNTVPGALSLILDGSVYKNGKYSGTGCFVEDPCTECTVLSLMRPYHQEEAKLVYGIEHLRIIKNRLTDKKIVLTSGCFDIVHVGHIHNLKKAREYGDVLMVCMSSDRQITSLKGPTRPINNIDDRLELFKTIVYVDYIILYDEENNDTEVTLDAIMKAIDPEYWVKGSDYTASSILDKHPSLRKVAIVPNLPDKSTTKIVQQILSSQ
jgi:rfaE bifunctional protein nucleotidyltransferase chain/domain